jgi:hypothetical protein
LKSKGNFSFLRVQKCPIFGGGGKSLKWFGILLEKSLKNRRKRRGLKYGIHDLPVVVILVLTLGFDFIHWN